MTHSGSDNNENQSLTKSLTKKVSDEGIVTSAYASTGMTSYRMTHGMSHHNLTI